MIQWVEFIVVVAFITITGWLFWDDIGSWYVGGQPMCTGCQRHFVKPGCPVHDTQDSRTS